MTTLPVWLGGCKMKGFEEIDHIADRAFRVTGRDMASLLENAARAMRVLNGPRAARKPSATRQVKVEGVDRVTVLSVLQIFT